jgi:hypothetical protein
MKTLIIAAILLAMAPIPAVSAQTPDAVARDRLVDVPMSTESRDGPPTGATAVSIVPGKVYVPPAGYGVAYTCSTECSYWLVENDTFYDRAAYSAKVAWMSAVALLGLLVCLGLLLGMFALGRDVVGRNGKGTIKVLNEMG